LKTGKLLKLITLAENSEKITAYTNGHITRVLQHTTQQFCQA